MADFKESWGYFGNKGAILIAEGIRSGFFPTHLELDISNNNIGLKGVNAIAEALTSGNCPEGLTLILSDEIGLEGANTIKKALSSGKCPTGLNIKIGHPKNDKKVVDIIANGMNNYRGLSAQRLNTLYQGMRSLFSPFRLLPSEIVYKIGEYTDPEQIKRCLNIYNKFEKEVLPLHEQFARFNIPFISIISNIVVNNKLEKICLVSEKDFLLVHLFTHRLQEYGLNCAVIRGPDLSNYIIFDSLNEFCRWLNQTTLLSNILNTSFNAQTVNDVSLRKESKEQPASNTGEQLTSFIIDKDKSTLIKNLFLLFKQYHSNRQDNQANVQLNRPKTPELD